ncbi:aspartic peptidase A1 [Mycena pura]|uniref:Aspartic peptidase A1 n=1 Tax=Mycena pura TaxID=153505 RepID=A0AAD6YRM3_9AGAR|nr:aspartic peptidase A1 [Mycena pura]
MLALLSLSFFVSLLRASGRRLIPPLNTLPLQLLPRDGSINASTVSGITPVTVSSDRQTYFAVLQTGEMYFRVALDTGSSDLWIIGSSCTTSSCTAVPPYPLEYQSPTFGTVNNNKTLFEARYADGTVASGFVATQSVRVANVTVSEQAFAIVTDCNLTMTDDISGILGLGFPRLSSISASVNGSTPFFSKLAQQGILEYPLFGVSLTKDARGSLSLGAIDTTIVTNVSKIDWNSVVEFPPIGAENNASSYLYWVTPLSAFAVNNTQMSPMPTYGSRTANSSLALIDIGTSGIYGPYPDVERLFARIDGSRLVDDDGQWVIPCETTVPMSFTFGYVACGWQLSSIPPSLTVPSQQTYTLEPTDYLIGPTSGDPAVCLSWPRALAPSGDGIDWQFGGPFLRTVYSIFSYGINLKEAPRIGFYSLQNNTETVDATAVKAFLSSVSATVATTLPNSLLPTPSISTPEYVFNSSIQAPTGGIVSSALATSTYSAIFGKKLSNVTSLPAITPAPTVTVVVTTNAEGANTTFTSAIEASFHLGLPPGWSAANGLHVSHLPVFSFVLLVVTTLIL